MNSSSSSSPSPSSKASSPIAAVASSSPASSTALQTAGAAYAQQSCAYARVRGWVCQWWVPHGCVAPLPSTLTEVGCRARARSRQCGRLKKLTHYHPRARALGLGRGRGRGQRRHPVRRGRSPATRCRHRRGHRHSGRFAPESAKEGAKRCQIAHPQQKAQQIIMRMSKGPRHRRPRGICVDRYSHTYAGAWALRVDARARVVSVNTGRGGSVGGRSNVLNQILANRRFFCHRGRTSTRVEASSSHKGDLTQTL